MLKPRYNHYNMFKLINPKIMYKKPSNISNPKKVNQTYKRKRNRQNHPPLRCLRNNPTTINFKTNFPKLFNLPKVQLKKRPKWPPKAVNIILINTKPSN